jgi:hypothetical protein
MYVYKYRYMYIYIYLICIVIWHTRGRSRNHRIHSGGDHFLPFRHGAYDTVDGPAKSESPVENGDLSYYLIGFNHPFGGAGFLPSAVSCNLFHIWTQTDGKDRH